MVSGTNDSVVITPEGWRVHGQYENYMDEVINPSKKKKRKELYPIAFTQLLRYKQNMPQGQFLCVVQLVWILYFFFLQDWLPF